MLFGATSEVIDPSIIFPAFLDVVKEGIYEDLTLIVT